MNTGAPSPPWLLLSDFEGIKEDELPLELRDMFVPINSDFRTIVPHLADSVRDDTPMTERDDKLVFPMLAAIAESVIKIKGLPPVLSSAEAPSPKSAEIYVVIANVAILFFVRLFEAGGKEHYADWARGIFPRFADWVSACRQRVKFDGVPQEVLRAPIPEGGAQIVELNAWRKTKKVLDGSEPPRE